MVPERFRPVIDAVEPVAARLRDGGYRTYLVGGVVRDLFMDEAGGRTAEGDLDLTTDAHPSQVKAAIGDIVDALWTQGETFGTIGCRLGGHTFEITTHRAEIYRGDSRKPDVTFGDDVDHDLSRRDFTINAMGLEVTAHGHAELIDPHGGLADLTARRLRTPLDPALSFGDDPLRMMRAARFIARFGLTPDDALVDAVKEMADRLSIVSAERVRDELDKLVVVGDPRDGMWFLVRTGLTDHFLPELPALEVEQDPIHRHKDVLAHTIAVVNNVRPGAVAAGREIDLRLTRLAALFHDVAKPATRAVGPDGVSFHHHEVVGARMTRNRMRALKYSNDDVSAVSELVYLHLRFHTYRMGWSDRAVRRYVRDAGDLLPELNVLTRCDCTTRNRRKAEALSLRMDELEDRIVALASQEELDAMRPDLDGNQIMSHLSIGPGREVGEALQFLLDLRLDEGPLGPEEATRRLDAWWAERGEA